jgi:hypothetical protein
MFVDLPSRTAHVHHSSSERTFRHTNTPPCGVPHASVTAQTPCSTPEGAHHNKRLVSSLAMHSMPESAPDSPASACVPHQHLSASTVVTRMVPGAPLPTTRFKETRAEDVPPRHRKWLSSVTWLRTHHAKPNAEALSRALQTLLSLPQIRRAAWATSPLLEAFSYLLRAASWSPLAPLLAVHVATALERHRTLCAAALRDASTVEVC